VIRRVIACALVLVAASACTVISPVPPITYLQLRSAKAAAPAADTPVVVVGAIEMPDYLLRDELLRRRSDYTLRYEPYQRWAEPLDLGIQRVVAANLGRELDSRRILAYPQASADDEVWHLAITVREFEALDERVVMRASGRWVSSTTADTRTAASVTFDESRRLEDASAGAIAAALSALLEEFSSALAREFPGRAP
jgi:uncharacterized lipoprotein YmbA